MTQLTDALDKGSSQPTVHERLGAVKEAIA